MLLYYGNKSLFYSNFESETETQVEASKYFHPTGCFLKAECRWSKRNIFRRNNTSS